MKQPRKWRLHRAEFDLQQFAFTAPAASTTGMTLSPQARLTIVLNGGSLGQLALYDDYTVEEETMLHKMVPQNTNGRPVRRVAHEGGRIVISATRQDASIEKLCNALRTAFYNQVIQPVVAATEEWIENDGTVTFFGFTNCTLDPKGRGSRRGNEPVKGQTLDLYYSDCGEINGTLNPYTALVNAQSQVGL